MVVVNQKAIEAYKLIFNSIDLSDFDNRLKFQKTIYLLKNFGIDFKNLHFTWFKRGPYCFELGGIWYEIPKESHTLTPTERALITQKKSLVLDLMQDSKSAELYSSIVFLLKEEKLEDSQVITKMGLLKPWFNSQEVEAGIHKMKQILTAN